MLAIVDSQSRQYHSASQRRYSVPFSPMLDIDGSHPLQVSRYGSCRLVCGKNRYGATPLLKVLAHVYSTIVHQETS